jgi:hypothetical protein
MEQFAGAVSPVQLKLVPELVVLDAANPVGALGTVVQLPAEYSSVTCVPDTCPP